MKTITMTDYAAHLIADILRDQVTAIRDGEVVYGTADDSAEAAAELQAVVNDLERN